MYCGIVYFVPMYLNKIQTNKESFSLSHEFSSVQSKAEYFFEKDFNSYFKLKTNMLL